MQHYGPVMVDLVGLELLPEERVLLAHPQVGGVIFFSRNYQNKVQLKRLVQAVRAAANRPLLLAVDHEGGRVWRFKEGFTVLPAAQHYGLVYAQDEKAGLQLAHDAGSVMAAELLDCDIDFSLTPILDLDKGVSEVIGDRAFHCDPEMVVMLTQAFIRGMRSVGMQATGKHFPGHGHCAPDSHVEKPVDDRELVDIFMQDMIPFVKLAPELGAMMPAHIVFPKVDDLPVGFSKRWLQDILREQLNFKGAIISDCLSMMGAEVGGDLVQRTELALNAGCDMVILCQQTREVMLEILETLQWQSSEQSHRRLGALQGHFQSKGVLPTLAFQSLDPVSAV